MRTEDGYLIQQCLNGDSTAFGFIVDKYKKSVYASALSRINNFHDAQDVTQEVFIKAYRNLRTLKRWDSFAGWLYRITANMCKDWSKSKSRRPDYEFVEDQELDLIDHVSMDTYQEDAVYKSVRDALESLPEIYREVLTLRYFGGMNIKEISSYLCASTSTIDRRLREALSQLKEEIPTMISTTYHQKELPASFTFRIVEMVKKINIHPISQIKGLPYGISLTTALLIAILSFNPTLISFKDVGMPIFSPMPVDSKVLEVGEIPVDIVKTSNISVISNLMGKGKGGELKPDMQNAFFMAPKDERGIWVNKSGMPTARAGFSACEVNGKIFVFGGLIGFDNRTPTLEEYDPSTDKWIVRDNMPITSAFSAIATANGKIYIIVGETNNGIVSTLFEYDPTRNAWAQKASMTTTREGVCACAVNGKIYAMGGQIAANEAGVWFMKAIPTVEEYDPTTNKWTSKADMPTPRQGFASAVVNGKIYIFGGFEDKFLPSGKLASHVDEYDPNTNTWITKASELPTPRVGLSAAVLNKKIYVIGGSTPPNIMHSIVEEYNTVSDTWTKMQDMLTKRWCHSTSVVNNKIYAIGGSLEPPPWRAETIVPAVEEYTPESLSNAVCPKGKSPSTWGQLK